MEHNVVITNNVNKGFLLTVKRLQHNIKWAKLRWNLFYIMFKIYWEGKTSKCYQVVASGQPLFLNTFLNFLQIKWTILLFAKELLNICIYMHIYMWNSYSENVLQVVPLLSTSYYFFVLHFYPNWQVQTRFP